MPMSRADCERAMDVVYMWIAEHDVDPEEIRSICRLFQVAQTCKAASAIIMPQIKKLLAYQKEKRYKKAEERLEREEAYWEKRLDELYD